MRQIANVVSEGLWIGMSEDGHYTWAHLGSGRTVECVSGPGEPARFLCFEVWCSNPECGDPECRAPEHEPRLVAVTGSLQLALEWCVGDREIDALSRTH